MKIFCESAVDVEKSTEGIATSDLSIDRVPMIEPPVNGRYVVAALDVYAVKVAVSNLPLMSGIEMPAIAVST